MVGCITPRMKLWNTNQNRHIHGLEALNFQGINYSIFGPDSNAKLLQYSSALLQDLAGNAFYIGCASAMLLSMFCSVGEAVREQDSPALRASAQHLCLQHFEQPRVRADVRRRRRHCLGRSLDIGFVRVWVGALSGQGAGGCGHLPGSCC